MSTTCDDARLALGAYALGTLEPADQDRVEAHLAACPACMDELAELQSVVPVLAGISLDDLEAPQPSPDLFARIAGAIDTADVPGDGPVDEPAPGARAAGRSRRWLVAVAASVVLLAGAGTAVGITLSQHSTASDTSSASAKGIHLQVTASDASSGTQLVLVARGLPQHEHCHLVATAADGSHHDAGTWEANYEGQARVVESTTVPRSQLRHLTLYGNRGRKLVGLDI